MAQSLVLSIDVSPGLGIPPLRTNIRLSFDRPTGITFSGVFEKFETFSSKICAHSERYRNRLAGIFEILTFMDRVSDVIGLEGPFKSSVLKLKQNLKTKATMR